MKGLSAKTDMIEYTSSIYGKGSLLRNKFSFSRPHKNEQICCTKAMPYNLRTHLRPFIAFIWKENQEKLWTMKCTQNTTHLYVDGGKE